MKDVCLAREYSVNFQTRRKVANLWLWACLALLFSLLLPPSHPKTIHFPSGETITPGRSSRNLCFILLCNLNRRCQKNVPVPIKLVFCLKAVSHTIAPRRWALGDCNYRVRTSWNPAIVHKRSSNNHRLQDLNDDSKDNQIESSASTLAEVCTRGRASVPTFALYRRRDFVCFHFLHRFLHIMICRHCIR